MVTKMGRLSNKTKGELARFLLTANNKYTTSNSYLRTSVTLNNNILQKFAGSPLKNEIFEYYLAIQIFAADVLVIALHFILDKVRKC